MKKLFVVSVVFLIIGIGSLAVSLYLYRIHGQRGPAEEMVVSGGVAEEKADTRVVYKKPETVDRSTPDKAVQSYWEYLDYVRSAKIDSEIRRYVESKRAFDEYVQEITPIEQPFLETFLSGDPMEARLKYMHEPDMFDLPRDPGQYPQIKYKRVIQGVEFESDTRAKVECAIYNVTPVDNLKQPLTEEEGRTRKRGIDFVYTTEKFKDGWKIIGKKAMCPNCLGTGYSGQKKCSWCDGTGWERLDVVEESDLLSSRYLALENMLRSLGKEHPFWCYKVFTVDH